MKKKKIADDNLHILLWLLKDISWMLKWKIFGIIMIFPTIAMALLILRSKHQSKENFLPDLAVLLWILANSLWMISEFYDLHIEWIPTLFFAMGLLTIISHFVKKYGGRKLSE
jgi:uncharacterized membrane protein YoaK (UPF0700 family)